MISSSSPCRYAWLVSFLLAVLAWGAPTHALPDDPQSDVKFVADAVFVENAGQWRPSTLFATAHGYPLRLTESGAFEVYRPATGDGRRHGVLRISFPGATGPLSARGVEPIEGRFHYLVGRDPSRWQRDQTGYAAIEVDGLLPRRGVRVSLERDRLHFRAAPTGPGVGAVTVRIDGWDLREEDAATLVSSFVRPGPGVRIGTMDRRDTAITLTLEPDGSDEVNWSTFLGGDSLDEICDLALDDDGAVVVVGETTSVDFPTTAGVVQGELVIQDAFVTRVSADGSGLEYSTFFGGEFGDMGRELTVLSDGSIVIAGQTQSRDLPITEGAYQDTLILGVFGLFVGKLEPDGAAFEHLTYLAGEDGFHQVTGLDLGDDGSMFVAGYTSSDTFPTTKGVVGPDAINLGPNQFDGFVAKLNSNGDELLWGSYLGGEEADFIEGLVLSGDCPILVGQTQSSELPVHEGAANTELVGGRDAFVARLSPDASSVEALTYLGGPHDDRGFAIALGPRGSVYVMGTTRFLEFPTTADAFDPIGAGSPTLFLSRLDARLTTLEYSTYISGGWFENRPMAIRVDSAGAVTMAGWTRGSFMPVTAGAFQTAKTGIDQEGFLLRLHPHGDRMLYGTYLGGSEDDVLSSEGIGLDVGPLGRAVFGSQSASHDYPTTPGSWQPDGPCADGADAVVTSLTMLPKGASRYGNSTYGPGGPIAIGVLTQPALGRDDFGFTCTNAPKHGRGFLLLSSVDLIRPLNVQGAGLWIDPAALIAVWRTDANDVGWAEQRVPIPEATALVGLRTYAQFLWSDPTTATGFLASNAMALDVQP